jgi:flagellar hook-basal body complex protein FliE
MQEIFMGHGAEFKGVRTTAEFGFKRIRALSTCAQVLKQGIEAGFTAFSGNGSVAGLCIVHAFQRNAKDGDPMDVSKIDAMLAQLQTGAALAAGKPALATSNARGGGDEGMGVDFTNVFRKSLDQVNNVQQHAAKLAQNFELGAPDANLTEAMISMQKASISFQYTLQVRNKMVSAYQDIMNMPV